MFENVTAKPPARVASYTFFSVIAHGLIIAGVVAFAGAKAKEIEKKVTVAFYAAKLPPTNTAPPPPPPPPPATKKRVTPKKTPVMGKVIQPIEIPKEMPKEETPPAEPEEDSSDDEGGVEGGVVGGVKGGVIGGVVGGVIGGTGTGSAEPPKPKNVPPFVIQRDLIRQTAPRLSEIYKQSHRGGEPQVGQYKICVATSGRVYEVTTLKSVAGADEDIREGIMDGWLYKPQQVPVCFLYNVPITVK